MTRWVERWNNTLRQRLARFVRHCLTKIFLTLHCCSRQHRYLDTFSAGGFVERFTDRS